MNYKNSTYGGGFLNDKEDNEYKKKIFFNIDELQKNGKLDSVFDYILKDWIGYISNLPIYDMVFFDLVQNGRLHSYKATPEKLQTIIQCLKTRNFDEILTDNPITSDPPEYNTEFVHVSGFGIRTYSIGETKIKQRLAGSFFNYLIRDNAPHIIKEQLRRYQIFETFLPLNQLLVLL